MMNVAYHQNGMLTHLAMLLCLMHKEFLRDLISLNTCLSLKHCFQLFQHLIFRVRFKMLLEVLFHSLKHPAPKNNIIIIIVYVMCIFHRISSTGIRTSPIFSSSTYVFLWPTRRILKLRCQSLKFDPDDFNFSFSRNKPKLKDWTSVTIYNKYLQRHSDFVHDRWFNY